MNKKIEPIYGVSVNTFPGLDFTYKGCNIRVTIDLEFDPCVWVNLSLYIDGVTVHMRDYSSDDEWYEWMEFTDMPEYALVDTDFHKLLKKVVRTYLKEEAE
jgi:hypothetical protein